MFIDRVEAGRQLADALRDHVEGDVVVLGIPRGGVVVAAEVARGLGCELDVVVPRKIGAPFNPELALGAIATGVQVWDRDLIERLRIPETFLEHEVEAEEAEIERRTAVFRDDLPTVELAGRTAILVDDGIATGSTALAALRWTRSQGAARIVLAVPVAPPETVERFRSEADDVVVLLAPRGFHAVGEWYERFDQTSDEEVVEALRAARERG